MSYGYISTDFTQLGRKNVLLTFPLSYKNVISESVFYICIG